MFTTPTKFIPIDQSNTSSPQDFESVEVSVVMPCLNEAETLETCIRKAQRALEEAQIIGEVIVADNGSTDGSIEIAEHLKARVVRVASKGYGSALMGGIDAAAGKFIIMGDADDSYDFGEISRFVTKLREGADLVVGNRFKGQIKPRAMPFMNRYLGNPVLSGLGKLFFKAPLGDFHCGLRGFSATAYQRLDLQATGMEFASEMVVKATLFKLRMAEVPITLSPDGRKRPPHLRPWRDGWRHLRFLLLYSPRWLFLYPGLALMALGVLLALWILPGPQTLNGVVFDVHTLVYAAAFILLGFQAAAFAVFTKVFAISADLFPPDPALSRMFKYITLEVGLGLGTAFVIGGLVLSVYAVISWRAHHFGPLNYAHTMRIVIPGVLFLILGVQTVLASFFLSVLGMRRRLD